MNKRVEKDGCSSPLEHWNYLGVDENLGPVAVSLRREKLEEHKDHGQQYNYRVIFRTSEVECSHLLWIHLILKAFLGIFLPAYFVSISFNVINCYE